MSTLEIAAGSTVTLRRTITVSGVPLTGATVRVDVVRLDGLVLDWSDATFKAIGSVVTRYQTLTEVSAANFPGRYSTTWDTSTITNATTPDAYLVTYYETAPSAYTLDQDEYLVGAFISTRASATALATAQGNITTILGYGAPPSAATIATQVDTTLSGTHGAGSWATASVAGLALEATLTAIKGAGWGASDNLHTIAAFGAPPSAATISTQVAADLATAHGAGSWLTADISTLATSAALASVAADTTKARRALYNRRTLSAGGLFTLYADDAVTSLYTATVTDVTGGAITVSAGEAARTTALT